MQLLEGYTADELHRVLSISRWVAGLLLTLGLIAIALNQWLVYRIAIVQKKERLESQQRLQKAEAELRKVKSQTKDVISSIDRLTAPRKLSTSQQEVLRASLVRAPKGKLIVTFLTVEWDAEEYARELAELLKGAGLDVAVSEHLWVDFEHDDLFLTAKEGETPPLATHLRDAFANVGIAVPLVAPGNIARELDARDGDAILVVSNRPK